MRTALVATAIVGAALTGCTPVDHDYHGSVPGVSTASEAPATHINAAPITVTGTGESVKTVDLESGGYTISYSAASGFLIVSPVKSSGDDGSAIINAGGTPDTTVTGTTNFHSNGRTTFHIRNSRGDWSLTFTPL